MRKMGIYLVATIVGLLSISEALDGKWDTVGHLSFNLMKEENLEVHNAKIFRHQAGLHVRHDLDVHLALKFQDYCYDPFDFELVGNDNMTVFTWSKRPLIQQGEFHFRLHINPNISVGHYTLDTSNPCAKQSVRLCDINVMFNPWHDSLHRDKVRRQATNNGFEMEYLQNNFGYIWLSYLAIPWDYAVGSKVVTQSKNRLTAMMTSTERSNQVQYSRALTRLIGSIVLYGRWDGNYNGGVNPSQWVGSEEILSRWLATRAPVRYAQCWVFAAILTSILRASGIPARPVTNYGSHHDRGLTNNRRAVLRQYDNIVQADESTWNFHVWSEAWLVRPDLGQPAGWNAVDATPQEPSPLQPGQPYRAGPAYVPYIRSNRRDADYDNYFVLAEVNARQVCPITGNLLPSNNIGYTVATKRPGMDRSVYNYNNYDDLTRSYKISSISKRQASDSPSLPPPYVGCEREGGMRINSTPPSPRVGENFTITVSEGNVSVEDIIIRMELRNYMGESLGIIRNFTGTRRLDVMETDYLPYLDSSSIFRFSVGEYNLSQGFVFHDDLRIRLEYSAIEVDATNNSGRITMMLTYTNPLSVPMTGVMVNIAGPDNDDYLMLEQPDIPANGRFTATITVPCGNNTDSAVMIPTSLDSNETESVYGTGWSTCSGSSNSVIATLPGITLWQMMFISLALCMYISV